MAAQDKTFDGVGQPAAEWFAITPNDDADLAVRPRAILVGVAGDLEVVSLSGTTEVLPVPAGYNPIRPVRVKATNTTATGLYGLY